MKHLCFRLITLPTSYLYIKKETMYSDKQNGMPQGGYQ